ncbi:MAG: transcriptional repressor LexA [Christensenellaceae bacterium]|jgi:repressor LexA|nr:transcriptional repressor LexA [Christensenellaceae bacterium]
MQIRKTRDERKKQLYRYVRHSYIENGIMPSVRELADYMKYGSTKSVVLLLRELERDGLIRVHKGKSRGVEILNVTPDDRAFLEVKEVSINVAGHEIYDNENILSTHFLPKSLFYKTGELVAVKFSGSSMRDVGILDGDNVIVKKQTTALNGQIVLAMIDEEIATIKRYYKSDNGVVRLHSENEDMKDIYPEKLDILGLVVGLVRNNIQ